MSASLRDLPPQFQLSPAECEMLQEELHGTVLAYGEPGAGAGAMKARLAALLGAKRQCLDRMDDCGESLFQALVADVRQLDAQIAGARARLADYLTQQSSAN